MRSQRVIFRDQVTEEKRVEGVVRRRQRRGRTTRGYKDLSTDFDGGGAPCSGVRSQTGASGEDLNHQQYRRLDDDVLMEHVYV